MNWTLGLPITLIWLRAFPDDEGTEGNARPTPPAAERGELRAFPMMRGQKVRGARLPDHPLVQGLGAFGPAVEGLPR